MSLSIGNQAATSGMTKAIYDELRSVLEPDLAGLSEDDLNAMRESWKKMAYAVAKGVIEHIHANMEIRGVQTRGNVAAAVQGLTAAADPGAHRHNVNLTGQQTNLVFTQSNDGGGLVD
jgi:hypothetical protein